jgi:ubiquinone/menaquinone biosynthesis C-methylase UbiE
VTEFLTYGDLTLCMLVADAMNQIDKRKDTRETMEILARVMSMCPGHKVARGGARLMRWTDVTRAIGMLRSDGIDGFFAYRYDEMASLPAFRPEYRKAAQGLAELAGGGLVLEIGPGPGYSSIELAKLVEDVQVVCLDASRTMIEIASRHVEEEGLADRIAFREGVAHRLPFPDEQFDLVFSSGSLHEWREAGKAFQEMHRVLRSGGRVRVTDLRRDANREALDGLARAIPSALMRWGLRHSVAEAYTRKGLVELLSQTAWSEYEIAESPLELSLTLVKTLPVADDERLGV